MAVALIIVRKRMCVNQKIPKQQVGKKAEQNGIMQTNNYANCEKQTNQQNGWFLWGETSRVSSNTKCSEAKLVQKQKRTGSIPAAADVT